MSADAPAAPPAPTGPPRPAADAGIGRAAAAITVARSVQMAAFLVTGMYLARRLGPGTYGTYNHVPFLALAIPMAVSVPVAKAVTYFVPRSRDPGRILRVAAAALALTGFASWAAIAFVPAVLRVFDPKDADLIALRATVGAIVAFGFAQAVSEYVLIVRGLRRGVVWLLLGQAAWNLFGIGGAAMFAPEAVRLEWTLLALLVATAIPAVVGYVWMLRPMPEDPTRTDPTRREVWSYLGPLFAAVGVTYAATQIDKFLVPHLFPMDRFPDAKDHYLRAAMDVPVVGAVALTMFGLVAPQLAASHGRGDVAGMLDVWRRTCRRIAIFTVPVAGLLCAVATEAFTLVYGDRYAPAVPVFRWYLVRIVLAVFLPQILLESVGSTGRALVFSAVSLAAAAALTAALVPFWGLAGAAAAAVLASVGTNWLFGGWLARHRLGVAWNDLLDWSHLVRLLAASGAAAAAAIWAVPADLVPDPAGTFAAWFPSLDPGTAAGLARTARHLLEGLVHGVAYAAAFVPLALALRSLSSDDLEMLRGIVRRRPARP